MAIRRNKNFLGLLVSGVFVVAAPLVGLALTNFKLQSAFREVASVDPSRKAALLADRISQSMAGAAWGLVVSIFALVPAVVFAVRFYLDCKRSR